VEGHSSESHSARILVACTPCHERKLKCDDNVPCRSCTRTSTACSRLNSHTETDAVESMILDNTNENAISYGINNVSAVDYVGNDSGVHHDNPQEPWLQAPEHPWSLSQLPTPGLDNSFPNEIPNADFTQWAVEPEQRHVEGRFPPTISDASIFGKPDNSLSGKSSRFRTSTDTSPPRSPASASSAPQNHGAMSDTSASTRSPISGDRVSLGADSSTLLSAYVDKESPNTQRLVQKYFAKIHSYWPILHAPTFILGSVSHVLLGSMVALAGWFDGEPDHAKIANLVIAVISATVPVCLQGSHIFWSRKS